MGRPLGYKVSEATKAKQRATLAAKKAAKVGGPRDTPEVPAIRRRIRCGYCANIAHGPDCRRSTTWPTCVAPPVAALTVAS